MKNQICNRELGREQGLRSTGFVPRMAEVEGDEFLLVFPRNLAVTFGAETEFAVPVSVKSGVSTMRGGER